MQEMILMNLPGIREYISMSNLGMQLMFILGLLVIVSAILFAVSDRVFESEKLKKYTKIGSVISFVIILFFIDQFSNYNDNITEKAINDYKKYTTEDYYINNNQYKKILDCFKTGDTNSGYLLFKNKKNNELEKFNLLIDDKGLKDDSNSNSKEKKIKVDVYINNGKLTSFEKLFVDVPEKLYVLDYIY